MTVVFISSPLREYELDGETYSQQYNQDQALNYMKLAIDKGFCPVVPHVMYPPVLNDHDQEERIKAIQLCSELVKRSDEVWFFLKYNYFSSGMMAEMVTAHEYGRRIRLFTVAVDLIEEVLS